MTDLNKTLEERGSRYGDFKEQARVTQNIKDAMKDSGNWKELAPYQKEALSMIAGKIGRILNGDANFDDSWHDISGYATLVEKGLTDHPKKANQNSEFAEWYNNLTPAQQKHYDKMCEFYEKYCNKQLDKL